MCNKLITYLFYYNAVFQKLVLFPSLGIRKHNWKVPLCLCINTEPVPEMLCFTKTKTVHKVEAIFSPEDEDDMFI
jgi:hypothetical protein